MSRMLFRRVKTTTTILLLEANCWTYNQLDCIFVNETVYGESQSMSNIK